MNKNLRQLIKKLSEYEQIEEILEKTGRAVDISGLTGSGKAFIAASLCQNTDKDGIYVCDSEYQAKKVYSDLAYFFGENAIFYPAKEMEYFEVDAKSNELINERISALEKLAESQGSTVFVMSIDALLQYCVDFDGYRDSIITIKEGAEFKIEKLIKKLDDLGMVREDMVEGVGQFSVRGGILDVFPPTRENPVRIEFFGDEVDSIREFDTVSQVSISRLSEVNVGAVSEKKAGESAKCCVLDYLSRSSLVFFDEPLKISERAEGFLEDINETVKTLIEKEVIKEAEESYINDYNEILKKLLSMRFAGLYSMPQTPKEYKPFARVSINMGAVNSFSGKMEFFFEDLASWVQSGYKIIALAGSEKKAQSLCEAIAGGGFSASLAAKDGELLPKTISVEVGSLKKGFYMPEIKLCIVSDEEVFGKTVPKKRKSKKIDGASKIKSFTDLNIGDYVVHQTHGVGRYEGLDTLTVDGCRKDYLKIVYSGDDFLYIPTEQLDLIQKYIGKDGRVRLNRMGGADFAKQKAKVKQSTKELAESLIKLYGERQNAKGFAFSPDTDWQKEFEDRFPYEETDDQLRSIEEVKRDMESDRPMDRLLCGDVGYGKTEVALRAVFKAVMDGKQAAVLAPTTVLVMQHFNTFSSRMKNYPITVEMISRFKKPSEQQKILKRLKKGEIDVLIGTHSLLGKNVEFKDLGLLVDDEEQRFGVKHKERLKEFKTNVDVLTLSATPIPRTLHMSMVNIRDMSVLTEPPEERHPVQTFVMEYNEAVIEDAIKKELARGGQVYFLHNRVEGIETTARRLREAIPDAKIAYAHGKMDENEMESIMVDMLEGEIDVLVCTTIIETGLDIPNVNTIIIENADNFGLAQLYQLKGRVGRSSRRAYAYLTYRKNKTINEIAVKRLAAIREFTEFGSGFKIAMRDLEIRGAGNILGAEQHGHIDSVGYDMYCKILAESVDELTGTTHEEEWQAVIDITVDAFISPKYISNHSQRLDMYKKIASIESNDDYLEVSDELIDRFGDIPKGTQNLLTASLLRAEAKELGFCEITKKEDNFLFYYKNDPDLEAVSGLIGEYSGRILLSLGERPYISLRTKKAEREEPLACIKNLLHSYKLLHIGKK